MANYHGRDTLSELLRLKEHGEEDVYFLARDRELIARMQARRTEDEELRARQLAYMRCPECGSQLQEVRRRGVTTEECPMGHGLWVPRDGLETIPEREHAAWFDRYVHMRW
jgi:uncharacterized protein with PIN domain